jgi:hypothetical protein
MEWADYARRHSGACAARTRNPSGNTFCGEMDSGFAPRGAPRNDGERCPRNDDGERYAGAAAVLPTGTGRNVIMMRKAPNPMTHEPM